MEKFNDTEFKKTVTLHNKFNELNNLSGLWAITRDYVLIFIIASFSIYVDNIFVYFLSVWLIGLLQFALGEVLLHEACHSHLFKNRKLNKQLSILYTLPFFNVFEAYRKSHINHHKYLGNPELDQSAEDYIIYGLNKENKSLFWIWFFKPVLGWAGFFYIRDTIIQKIKQYPYHLLSFWIFCSTFFYWINALDIFMMYWVIPLIWSFPTYLYWSEISDHYNTSSGTRSNLNPIHNYICHNNGYHALHHRYPSIPWCNSPQAYRELKEIDESISKDIAYGFFDTYKQLKEPK